LKEVLAQPVQIAGNLSKPQLFTQDPADPAALVDCDAGSADEKSKAPECTLRRSLFNSAWTLPRVAKGC